MQDKKNDEHFITFEKFQGLKKANLSGPNGWLLFVACNSGIDFAHSVKDKYEEFLRNKSSELKSIPIMGTHEKPITLTFSDTETCPRLQGHVAGSNAYVFQCVQEKISENTVNDNIQQMLQVVITLRSHGAKTITVVIPYSPYSRQDKPTFMKREASQAGFFADQLKTSKTDVYLTYHPHTLSLYGFYEPHIKFVALSGLDHFISIFKKFKNMENIIAVSTDEGGAKFNVHFSQALNISYAIANKYRFGKDKSNLLGIVGDLKNKDTAIIIDDETVTGDSIIQTIKSLYTNYNIKKSYVAISHMKLKKENIFRFVEAHKKYGLKKLYITDTIPQISELKNLDFVVNHSIAEMFAITINRLHYNQSVTEVFSRS
jgi:ribose-phosphate pyrophosphokinase